MAKNYFGVVLTTKEHDKYRLVVYRYKDPGILNTCPMCQLLRAIHKFQQEYAEIHREHCSRIPPRKWYELGRVMPSIVLRKYGLEKHYEMSFEPSRVPPASALKLIPGATASNWKQYIWYVDGDVTMHTMAAHSKFSFANLMVVFAMRLLFTCMKADSGQGTALAVSTRLRFATTLVLSMP